MCTGRSLKRRSKRKALLYHHQLSPATRSIKAENRYLPHALPHRRRLSYSSVLNRFDISMQHEQRALTIPIPQLALDLRFINISTRVVPISLLPFFFPLGKERCHQKKQPSCCASQCDCIMSIFRYRNRATIKRLINGQHAFPLLHNIYGGHTAVAHIFSRNIVYDFVSLPSHKWGFAVYEGARNNNKYIIIWK